MANLPTSNNNPGDLRNIGQVGATQGAGGFASFQDPKAGYAALLNDLQTKINNNPQHTLVDFASQYAPASDGNNPAQYAANLANQLGVAPNVTIGSLEPRIGALAQAVSKNEGYQGGQQDAASTVGAQVQLNPPDLPKPQDPNQSSVPTGQSLSNVNGFAPPMAPTQSAAPQSNAQTTDPGFLNDITSGNIGGALGDATNFAFPIAGDIKNDIQGTSNKNLLQQAADAGLSALWFAPGLDALAPETAAALEGAGTLGKLASGGLYGAGIGATAGGLGAVSQGQGIGGILKGAALGGATGGVLGGAGAGASQFLGNLPNRIARGALKLDPTTAQYALDTKGIGTINGMAVDSQKSIENLSGQIQDILNSEKYANAIPEKPLLQLPEGTGRVENSTPIKLPAAEIPEGMLPSVRPAGGVETTAVPPDIVQRNPVQGIPGLLQTATPNLPGNGTSAFADAASSFPNSNYTPGDIFANAKTLIPEQDKLLDKIQAGTATLAEKNMVRSALDQATKSVYTTMNRPPETKALGKALAGALRIEVKTTAPETVDLFSQLQEELHLQTALKKLQKRAPGNMITFRDLLAAGIGGGLGGIPLAAGGLALEKLGTTPGGQFATAKAIQGLLPAAQRVGQAGLIGGARFVGGQ